MSEWEQLRQLLLLQEQDRLKQLEAELKPSSRLQRLKSDLPATLEQLEQDTTLRSSLSKPVTAALHESIERDKESVASLLFPVMGPAIRRAVQESLRTALQRINLALEHGLSPRAWRWRLEAWRSGEPFAQIVLRHSVSYSVDEVFLIHRATGLMMSRRTRREVLALDQDAVASMLTAIQNFLRQSLTSVADDPLRTVEMGGATLWLVNGPDAILAVIIQGEPPNDLRELLQETSEQTHAILREQLKQYQGDGIEAPRVEALLDRLLIEQKPTKKNSLPGRIVWAAMLILLIYWLSIWFINWQSLRQAENQLHEYVDETPGLTWLNTRSKNGQLHISLLRDPLAPTLEDIYPAANISKQQIQIQAQSYISQDTEIILKRMANAASIHDPETLQLNGQTLLVNKALAPQQWQSLALLQRALAPQFQLDIPKYDINTLRKQLAIPETVELSQLDTELILNGEASAQWYDTLPDLLADLPIRFNLQTEQFELSEAKHLQEAVESLDGRRLHFINGLRLSSGSEASLDGIAERLHNIQKWAKAVQKNISIELRGMSDSLGHWQANLDIRQARAQYIANSLATRGITQDLIKVGVNNARLGSGFQPELRHVEIRISIEDQAL